MAEQSSAEVNAEINSEANGDGESAETPEIPHQRPPLLETPAEYDPQTNWDCQDWSQQVAHMPWQNNRGGAHGVPPPPRPPYGMQFQYGAGPGVTGGNDNNPFAVPSGSPMAGGGRGGSFGGPGGGRGRGSWDNSPQNQFRNFPRPPRGGGGGAGSPFFNRGRGRGVVGGNIMMRGGPSPGFRGKFRGKNNWI